MKEQRNCMDEEIVVCDTLFNYNLVEVGTNTYNLLVSACNNPTATYFIGTITQKANPCTGLTYYQMVINGNPVEIIQDCSLCNIIAKAIETYFTNLTPINCNGNGGGFGKGHGCCGNNNQFYGFF